MAQKNNALIIGCGNIGALYDIKSSEVLTHAKALYLTKKFNLFFYDTDHELSKKIANKYRGTSIEKITDELLNSAHWISVCSPTDTHYSYLVKLLYLNNKFILCEKPVSYHLKEIDSLKEQYKKSSPAIYVNYIRRFNPAYINIKKKFSYIFKRDKLKECSIEYCRGFINNASHAFDLLEFLMDEPVDLSNIRLSKRVYDVYKNDPTLSMTADWNNAKITVNGHPGASRFLFQVKLIFGSYHVEFLNSGNDILIYEKDKMAFPLFRQGSCLKNYMKYVIDLLVKPAKKPINSNFATSLDMNKKLLSYIR